MQPPPVAPSGPAAPVPAVLVAPVAKPLFNPKPASTKKIHVPTEDLAKDQQKIQDIPNMKMNYDLMNGGNFQF